MNILAIIMQVTIIRKEENWQINSKQGIYRLDVVNGVIIESERNLKYPVSLKEQLELSLCSDKYKDVVIVKLSVCQN